MIIQPNLLIFKRVHEIFKLFLYLLIGVINSSPSKGGTELPEMITSKELELQKL
jgi:hypothetical protein